MITDELRKYVQSWRETPNLMDDLDAGDIDGLLGDFEHIADRIDAKHESACAEAYGNGVMSVPIALDESAYVELPVDADGEYIHVGDVMEFEHRGKMLVAPVDTIELSRDHEGYLWSIMVDHQCVRYSMGGLEMRHHKPPTVEDVLLEACKAYHALLIEGMSDVAHDMSAPSEIIAEYAAKLRLANSEE